MADSFNPYREWLGLEGTAAPDFYQMLGIERDADLERIHRAADYAINRVRTIRPGNRAAEWMRLIDELRTAQNVLSDLQRRTAYDATLPAAAPRNGTAMQSSGTDPTPAAIPQPMAHDAYPPGAEPHAKSASQPLVPVDVSTRPSYADPMAPVAIPTAYPTPMAPAAAPSYGIQPAPVAPVTPQSMPAAQANIPFARPVGAPIAVSSPSPPTAYQGSPTHAPPATPAGSPVGLDPLAPTPTILPSPVKKKRKRSSHLQNLVLLGVAAAMIAAVVIALNAGLNNSHHEESPTGSVANRGNPAPRATNPRPINSTRSERPRSSPPRVPPVVARSEPEIVTAPEMTSEPEMADVHPTPAPEAPAEAVPGPRTESARPPTEAETAQTQQAVQAALAALKAQDFDGADSQLAQVEELPKSAEDEKKYVGAKQLAKAAGDFARALKEGFAGLKADQQLTFNNASVTVKEATPESMTIEVVAGVTKQYTPDNLPLGLKYGLVNTVIPTDDPANPLAKAAWHATHPEGDPAEVGHFLDLAQAAGADVQGARALVNAVGSPAVTVAVNPEPTSSPPPATPEPTGQTPPSTAAPEPSPAPTARELRELTKLVQTARIALQERNLDEANDLIAKAETLAKLSEHQQKISNLKQLAHYAGEFWRAVDESLKTLSSMGELMIGDTVVSIVESRPDHLVIKVTGQVKRYNRRDMPGGLAMAIANKWFKEDDPAAKAARGALYALEKKGDPGRARELWQEAGQMGLDTSPLLSTLDEEFDFTK